MAIDNGFSNGESRVEQVSPHDFKTTLERVTGGIEGAGLTIFAVVDHAAAARDVGLMMPPTTVLFYGNPRGGTPIMVSSPDAALDLPLRVLVRESPSGRVSIVFHAAAPMLRAAGVPDEIASRLDPAQALLARSLS